MPLSVSIPIVSTAYSSLVSLVEVLPAPARMVLFAAVSFTAGLVASLLL